MAEDSYTKFLEEQNKNLMLENEHIRNLLTEAQKVLEPLIPVMTTMSELGGNNEKIDADNFVPVRKRSELPSERRERLERESYQRMITKRKAASGSP